MIVLHSLIDSILCFTYCKSVLLERFSNDCRKTKTKAITPTNPTGADSAMNQSQFPAVTCNPLKAREKSRVHGAIGFASHWLKNWHESF